MFGRGPSAIARLFGMLVIAIALVACNTNDPTLGLGGDSNTGTNGASQVQTGSPTIFVAPIIGSTVEAVTPLSRRLASGAAERGIAIGSENDPAVSHILRGYFSALSEDGRTTVIYVWDVFEPEGTRLHRIQGQLTDPAPATRPEPWSNVSPQTMERIADLTLDGFAAWLATSSNTLAVPAEPGLSPAPVSAPAASGVN